MSDVKFAAIELGVKHTKLSIIKSATIASGNKQSLLCKFVFRSSDWANTERVAVFQGMTDYIKGLNQNKILVPLTSENDCIIPAEVLENQDEFLVGITGKYEDGAQIVSNFLAFKIDRGCYCTGSTPSIPSSIEEELLRRIDLKQDKLTAGENISIVNNVISATGAATSLDNDLIVTKTVGGVQAGTVFVAGTSLMTILTQMLTTGEISGYLYYGQTTNEPTMALLESPGVGDKVMSAELAQAESSYLHMYNNGESAVPQYFSFAYPSNLGSVSRIIDGAGFDEKSLFSTKTDGDYTIYYMGDQWAEEDFNLTFYFN